MRNSNWRKRIDRATIAVLFAITFLPPTILAADTSDASPTKPDLTGAVRSKDGAALRDASVFVFTANPRVGPGFL